MPPVQRLLTEVPGLDLVLNGGLIQGGLYIIQGSPGTGKTVLGNQICFNHVQRAGGRAAYVTLLSELVARMTHFLEPLKFFDHRLIGDRLQYLGMYQELRKGGLAACQSRLQRLIKDHDLSFFVVDGADALKFASKSDVEFREFLHGSVSATERNVIGHPAAVKAG
jgi:circadian clock protein KaiC